MGLSCSVFEIWPRDGLVDRLTLQPLHIQDGSLTCNNVRNIPEATVKKSTISRRGCFLGRLLPIISDMSASRKLSAVSLSAKCDDRLRSMTYCTVQSEKQGTSCWRLAPSRLLPGHFCHVCGMLSSYEDDGQARCWWRRRISSGICSMWSSLWWESVQPELGGETQPPKNTKLESTQLDTYRC